MKKANQVKDNPFPYSHTNKRYYTIDHYFQNKYHAKTAKVPLHAGFTCPNRDGTKGIGGCAFCSELGSGDTILAFHDTLQQQYELGLARMRSKWPDCIGIAYFQSFTNTYAPLDTLKKLYDPFFERSDVAGVCIATRADCLDDEMIAYFAEKAQHKEVWIELGLQSIHDHTMDRLNRGHSSQIVFDVIEKLKPTPVKTCVHLINSLPGETEEMMLETAQKMAEIHPDAIKIHMLHVIQNSALGRLYNSHPFPLMSEKEYVDLVVKQLELLPQDMIIERLTGDALKEELMAPAWTLKKTIVLNDIDKRMVELDTYQGKYYKA